MEEKTRVFEIRKTVDLVDNQGAFILEYDEDTDQWVYISPSAQKNDVHRMKVILEKLEELNKR